MGEFVKTQLQLDDERARKKGIPKRFYGSMDVLKQTLWSGEGGSFKPTAIFRGLSVLLFCAVPKVSVRFSGFEGGASWIAPGKPHAEFTLKEAMFAGFCAGACEATFVVTPQETIKVKIIHDNNRAQPRYKGLFHAISTIYKELGWRGCYAGYIATLTKESTSCLMRFSIMFMLKDWYRKKNSVAEPPLYMTALFAACAGVISVSCNMPVDVVKTRMQGLEQNRYKNFFHCAQVIYKDDGIRGYYKGIVPRIGRVVIELMVCFTVFDYLRPKAAAITDSAWKKAGWD